MKIKASRVVFFCFLALGSLCHGLKYFKFVFGQFVESFFLGVLPRKDPGRASDLGWEPGLNASIFGLTGPHILNLSAVGKDTFAHHLSHSIHVWHIYLDLVDFYGKCR